MKRYFKLTIDKWGSVNCQICIFGAHNGANVNNCFDSKIFLLQFFWKKIKGVFLWKIFKGKRN